MGKVQKKLGRLHEALANFNQALDLDPKAGNMIKAHIDRLQVKLICALRGRERKRKRERERGRAPFVLQHARDTVAQAARLFCL